MGERASDKKIISHTHNAFFQMDLQQSTFENIVAKGEIADYDQFLLLVQCLRRLLNENTFIYRDVPYFCLDFFQSFLYVR